MAFEEGSTTLGTADVNSDGIASLTFTPSTAGTASINVVFSGDVNDQPSSTTIDLTIAKATPTLTWADPASITAGTALSATQLDATASFDGTYLPGLFVYTPAAGTVLPAGNGQTLLVTFQPSNTTDFQSVTASVPINVLPQTPVTIVSERPIFKRKTNKKGKPVGKPVLVGFSFSFNEPLSASAAADSTNYKVDNISTRVIKKKTELDPRQDLGCHRQLQSRQRRGHHLLQGERGLPDRWTDHRFERCDRRHHRRARRPDGVHNLQGRKTHRAAVARRWAPGHSRQGEPAIILTRANVGQAFQPDIPRHAGNIRPEPQSCGP